MAKQGSIPEVDIVIDHEAGVIREVHPSKLRNKKTHARRVNRGIYTLLSVISVIWLAPFVFLVLQSFRSYLTEDGGMVSYILPKAFSLDNYRFLFEDGTYLRWYSNTLIISLFCSVIQTGMVLSVSYVLSRLRFRGRRFIMNMILVLGMFPGFLTMIALYFLLKPPSPARKPPSRASRRSSRPPSCRKRAKPPPQPRPLPSRKAACSRRSSPGSVRHRNRWNPLLRPSRPRSRARHVPTIAVSVMVAAAVATATAARKNAVSAPSVARSAATATTSAMPKNRRWKMPQPIRANARNAARVVSARSAANASNRR